VKGSGRDEARGSSAIVPCLPLDEADAEARAARGDGLEAVVEAVADQDLLHQHQPDAVDGVAHDVDERLLHRAAVQPHGRHSGLDPGVPGDPKPPAFGPEQTGDPPQQLFDRDRLAVMTARGGKQ